MQIVMQYYRSSFCAHNNDYKRWFWAFYKSLNSNPCLRETIWQVLKFLESSVFPENQLGCKKTVKISGSSLVFLWWRLSRYVIKSIKQQFQCLMNKSDESEAYQRRVLRESSPKKKFFYKKTSYSNQQRVLF